MQHKTTILDIASKSGFSISTVSRVLNGKAEDYRISEATQNKIKAIAKELNYSPNEFARNLRTGRSKTIALIVPSLKNPFFAEMASVINAEVRKHKYITIIGDSDDNIDNEKTELNYLLSRNLDGVIIVPSGSDWEHLDKVQKTGTPLICIDRYFEDQEISFVTSDNYGGAYTATKYLIEQGHRSIACIQGVTYSTPNEQRVRGYQDAMTEYGIVPYSISGDAFSEQNGYLETKILLHNQKRPTAIFAFSNTIAMGCIRALREENVSIPDDISLVTFDNSPYQDFIKPALTCVSQPIEDICKIAVKLLFSEIQENKKITKRVYLKTKLNIKESIKNISRT